MIFRPRNVLPPRRLSVSAPSIPLGQWRERTWPAINEGDWIGTRNGPNPYPNALEPYHGEDVGTSTPFIMWPDLGPTHTFRVRIYNSNGVILHTIDSEPGNNFILVPPAKALPLDQAYRWTVQSLTDATTYPESSQRHFYVLAGATPYTVDVPGAGSTLGIRLHDKLLSLDHPRSVTKDTAMFANMQGGLTPGDVRYKLTTYIESSLASWEALAVPTEASGGIGSWYGRTLVLMYYWKLGGTQAVRARNLIKKILLAAITYYDGTNGFKRGYGTINSVAQTGAATSYAVSDLSCRAFVLFLAIGYDLFKTGSGTDLTQAEQTRLLEYLDYRVKEMYDELAVDRALQVYQYESHGVNNIGFLAYTCALIAESDMSAFPSTYGLPTLVPQVVRGLLPLWMLRVQAFRCDDGSSHRGGGYDNFDAVANPMVCLTLQMFGIDLMDKPRFYNASLWRMYMNGPPYKRDRSQFGDGATDEVPYYSAYVALNMRYPSSLTNYAYGGVTGTQLFERSISYLPVRGAIPQPKAPTMLSRIFPIGGYYASLDSLTDEKATAVYMRASKLGGFNHAHHDMNSIVVWGRNEMLLIDSGYYNEVGYGTPHFGYWQRHSRAHNTLSMDNGAGQQTQNSFYGNADTSIDMLANGRMICWAETGEYSYAIGDATPSYKDAGFTLSAFRRAVVHFRNDVVLTFDYAQSSSGAHTWDWNFHTDNAVTYAGGVYTVTKGVATGYVQNLYCNSALQAPTAWASGARTSGQYNYSGWDGPQGFSGTVASSTATSITPTGAAFTVNQYKDHWITTASGDKQITSNTATTLNWSGAIAAPAVGSAFTVADLYAPAPPSTFVGRQQYHHRISTATPTTEYKAVTAVMVGSSNLISNVSASSDAQNITLAATINGRARTIVFNFVNNTVSIT